MIAKLHSAENSTILTLCDDSLVGHYFEEGDRQLDLTADFFKGEKVKGDKAIELIGSASILFLVGEESIAFAIKLGVMNDGEMKRIAGIPYGQVVQG